MIFTSAPVSGAFGKQPGDKEMAQFNIDNSLSNGKRIEWLALPSFGETPEVVETEVRRAAMKKFGEGVWFNHWEHVTGGDGYVVVRMYA